MFIEKAIRSKTVIILVILSISLIISQSLGILYVNAQLNSTSPTINQTITQQPEATELKPFTLPRDNQAETEVSSSSSNAVDATTNDNNQSKNDLVLLSQRYNSERFGDEIVGEILNNGTITAEYAKVSVSFYDANGAILGSEFTYADPSTIPPGDRAAFTIHISSDTIEDYTERYEFTLQWRDSDFNDFSKRITGEQADSSADNNDNDNDNNNDNDNDNNNDNDNDNNNDNDGNALEQLNDLFRS